MKLGATIKKLRKERAINQTNFAEQCGISQTYLSQIEKDERNPTISVLDRICDVLKIPSAVLLFMSLSIDSVPEDRREIFKTAKPILDGIIGGVFL